MPDTSSKNLEFRVGVDGNDFQSLMEKLRQLEQAAKGVANSFAAIKAGTSGAAGGAALPGVPTPASVAGGMGAAGDPEIVRIQTLKKSYEDLTSALKNYRAEKDIVGRVSGGTGSAAPTPAGLVDPSGRLIRPLDTMSVASSTGSARGPSYSAFEAQTVNINAQTVNINGPVSGGGDGAGGGGTGAGAPPALTGGGGVTPSAPSRKSGGLQRGVAAIQTGLGAAESALDVYKYQTFAGLKNQAAQQGLNDYLLQSVLSGNVAPLIAMKRMGGYESIQGQYGLSGINTLGSYMKLAGGVTGIVGGLGGMAAGAAIGTAVAPGLGTAVGGLVGALGGGIFGSMVSGGVRTAGYSATDLMTGKVDAQEQQNILDAIQTFQRTNPFLSTGLDMFSQRAPHMLAQTRRLRGLGSTTSTQLYEQIKDQAVRYNVDPDRAVDMAIGISGQIPLGESGSRSILAASMMAEQLGYDPTAIEGSLSSLYQAARMGYRGKASGMANNFFPQLGLSGEAYGAHLLGMAKYARKGNLASLTVGANKADPLAFIDEMALRASSQFAVSRFGGMSDEGIFNVQKMLVGGEAPPQTALEFSMRERAMASLQADTSKTLPYMVRLEKIKQIAPNLDPYKQMLVAQMSPMDLQNPAALARLGISSSQAQAILGAGIGAEYGLALDPTKGVGATIQRPLKQGGFGGDVLGALRSGKLKEEQLEEIAQRRSAFMGTSLDVEMARLRELAIKPEGYSEKSLVRRAELGIASGATREAGDPAAAETVKASRALAVELERRIPDVIRQFSSELRATSERLNGLAATFTTASGAGKGAKVQPGAAAKK
jgi:hypothetical protein